MVGRRRRSRRVVHVKDPFALLCLCALFMHSISLNFMFFVLSTLCSCLETECAISLVNCRHISSTSRIVGIYMEYGIAIYTIQHIDGLLTLHVVFARCPSLIASCSLVLTDLCSLDVLRRWVDSMLGSFVVQHGNFSTFSQGGGRNSNCSILGRRWCETGRGLQS